MSFEPELGQMLNGGGWDEYPTPDYVTAGIDLLGQMIARGDYMRDPTANHGAEDFDNGTFVMRTYCWCDGEEPGHEDGCPPNFKYGDFEARWYKHAHRGESCNRVPSLDEWRQVMIACLSSLGTDRPAS